MKNYIAVGRVLNVLAAAAIASGELVKVGEVVGVAAVDIPATETGSVNVTGVYEVPKAAGAVAQGDKLYYDATAKNLTKTTTAPNVYAGYAYESAAAGDAVVLVKLVG